MNVRLRALAVIATLTLSSACGVIGGGGAEKDTSTRPDAPEELARTPVPAGGDPPHWAYEGAQGPEYWGELAEDWATCADGSQQSPIDVSEGVPFEAEPTTTTNPDDATTTTKKPPRTTTTQGDGSSDDLADWPGAPAEQEIDFRYHASAYTVTDNGHTVQVNLDDAGEMVIDGVPFTLLQFHFHTPSEHTLGGAAYPMEYHLVHRNEAGELAVVGVMVQWGEENQTLKAIFDQLPDNGATVEGTHPLDPAELLPPNRTMVRYNGSLTTPPCSEKVRWHVMLTPMQLSKLQVARFVARHPDSARPVQDANDRSVVVELDTFEAEAFGGAAGSDTGH